VISAILVPHQQAMHMTALTKRPPGGISRPHFLCSDDFQRKGFETRAGTTEAPPKPQVASLLASYAIFYLPELARRLSHSLLMSMNQVPGKRGYHPCGFRVSGYPTNRDLARNRAKRSCLRVLNDKMRGRTSQITVVQSYFCRLANEADCKNPRNRIANLEKSWGKTAKRNASRKRNCKVC
jgi:hypothetical protein